MGWLVTGIRGAVPVKLGTHPLTVVTVGGVLVGVVVPRVVVVVPVEEALVPDSRAWSWVMKASFCAVMELSKLARSPVEIAAVGAVVDPEALAGVVEELGEKWAFAMMATTTTAAPPTSSHFSSGESLIAIRPRSWVSGPPARPAR